MVEQFRLPALLAGSTPWQLEAAAGLVDSGETPPVVAIRETQEETGLALIGEPIPIQRYLPSAGGSDESLYLFCGRVDARAAHGIHGLPEEHEDIRVVVKPLSEIEGMVDAGQIENGHTLIALYWLLRHRERLQRLWLVATRLGLVMQPALAPLCFAHYGRTTRAAQRKFAKFAVVASRCFSGDESVLFLARVGCPLKGSQTTRSIRRKLVDLVE